MAKPKPPKWLWFDSDFKVGCTSCGKDINHGVEDLRATILCERCIRGFFDAIDHRPRIKRKVPRG